MRRIPFVGGFLDGAVLMVGEEIPDVLTMETTVSAEGLDSFGVFVVQEPRTHCYVFDCEASRYALDSIMDASMPKAIQ